MESFFNEISNATEAFRKIDDCHAHIVSHLDSDGISAAAIMLKALNRENKKCKISVLSQLDENQIKKIRDSEEKTVVFTDLGSGQISLINKYLSDKKVFILDHHYPEEEKARNGIIHINPHLQGIDGGQTISGAGVVYLFSKELNPQNKELAHLAVIGAIGDVQEDNGFTGLNCQIFKEAKEHGNLSIEKGLNLFGLQTKPLHKVLGYSSDVPLPGISGSENNSIQFLNQIGISPKKNGRWKRISDLKLEEVQKLTEELIKLRQNEKVPEKIIGDNYILSQEEAGTQFRDAKEFSTVLNSCGRLGHPLVGIDVCLGNNCAKKKALEILTGYKKEIVNAMSWFHNAKGDVFEENGLLIINAKNNIRHTVAGTIASILAKSKKYKDGTIILSMARNESEMTKISLRIAAVRPKQNIDLKNILSNVVNRVGGEAGGHKYAAGALIPTAKEDKFLSVAKEVLRENVIIH